MAAELARATRVAVADRWTATKQSFLGSVPKVTIYAAVIEARGVEVGRPLKTLEREALIAEAERLLRGSRWLPEPLR